MEKINEEKKAEYEAVIADLRATVECKEAENEDEASEAGKGH